VSASTEVLYTIADSMRLKNLVFQKFYFFFCCKFYLLYIRIVVWHQTSCIDSSRCLHLLRYSTMHQWRQ